MRQFSLTLQHHSTRVCACAHTHTHTHTHTAQYISLLTTSS